MKKPKLLWVSHMVPYPPKAGLLIRSYNLIKEISSEFDISLYALSQSSLIEPYFESYEEGLRAAHTEMSKYCTDVYFESQPVSNSTLSKVTKTLRSLIGSYPYSVRWLFKKKFKEKIDVLLESHGFDAIYWDSIGLYQYFPKSTATNAPQILGHHNIESHMMNRRQEMSESLIYRFIYKLESRKLEQLEKASGAIFSSHVVCSDEDNKRLGHLIDSKSIVTVPNGFDFDLVADFKRKPKPGHLLFVGTMDWYPNVQAVEFLIRSVFPKVATELPGVRLDVIGANPPQELIQLASEYANVDVHGYVDDLVPYMQNASLYICPISDGGGTKLKVIEAFAYKIPMIAHPIACEGLNVEEDKHVKFAIEAEDFVEKILRMESSISESSEMAQNAYDHALEEFSFSSVATKFSSALKASISETT
ncbi:glycosyltransferase family 4 protein [Reinekea sp. G2M2-21]|uniref:glycosyltransferase family 4 protein n=1 Tax=Reinekea sp. G2M2-21 TaxID=2788942 RepID=UPI0018AB367A|nr:glycosyltransferase family 4 protein [Reinekea sp. G2M2-21]